jgi:hypothetical protein
VLRPQLDALREIDRPGFVAAVVDRMAEPVVDYIRLELEAEAG